MTTILQPVPCTTGTSRLSGAGQFPSHAAIETESAFDSLAAGITELIDTVLEWYERDRQRRHLMTLDDRMLKDIGVSRADALRESGKRPWQT